MEARRTFYPLDWWRWLRDEGIFARLAASEQAVVSMLLTYADAHGKARPSIARLMAVTGYSERAVQRAVERLQKLRIIDSAIGGGRHRTTTYLLSKGGPMPLFSQDTEQDKTPSPTTPFEDVNPVTGDTVRDRNPVVHDGVYGRETPSIPTRNPVTSGTPSENELKQQQQGAVEPETSTEQAAPVATSEETTAAAAALLVAAGLSPGKAAELAGLAGGDAKRIELLLGWADYQRRHRRPILDLERWLYAAITTPYEIPAVVATEARERAQRAAAAAEKRADQDRLAATAVRWFRGLQPDRVLELREAAAAKLAKMNYSPIRGEKPELWVQRADLTNDPIAALLAVRAMTRGNNGPMTREERASVVEVFGGKLY